MKKLRELLSKLGFKDDVLNKYLETDDEKTKDLNPETDAQAIVDAVKLVYRNEIEPDIKKQAEITSRAHVYGEVEKKLAAKGNFKPTDLGMDSPKLDDYIEYFHKTLSKTPDDATSKGTIKKLQEDLAAANQKAIDAETKIEGIKTSVEEEWKAKFDAHDTGIAKTNYVLKSITGLQKKTLIASDLALTIVLPKIEQKYALTKNDKGEFEIRDKSNPEKLVNKSATEFLTVAEVLEQELEGLNLFEKSNGGDGKKEKIPGEDGEGGNGGAGGATKTSLSKAAILAAEAAEKM